MLRSKKEDATEAGQYLPLLMGGEVEPRRAFVQRHAKDVTDFDAWA